MSYDIPLFLLILHLSSGYVADVNLQVPHGGQSDPRGFGIAWHFYVREDGRPEPGRGGGVSTRSIDALPDISWPKTVNK